MKANFEWDDVPKRGIRMKNKSIFILIFCMIALFTACGKTGEVKDTGTLELGENMISIYYPGSTQILKDNEPYQIKQPDSISVSVEEIMAAMSEKLEQEKIQYHTYMIDADNNVTLEFTLTGEYDKEYFLLARAAVTKTLFQLEDIKSIIIILNNDNEEVLLQESYGRDSFYYY